MSESKHILLVGLGIAGVTLSRKLKQHNHKVTVVSDLKPGASTVAAGVYNPVVLKRFTAIWQAQEQLEGLVDFYSELEELLPGKYLHQVPVLRRFYDEKEIKTWHKKQRKEVLIDLLDPEIDTRAIDGIHAPAGYGRVLNTGWVNTGELIQDYAAYLKQSGSLIEEAFDYNEIQHHETGVSYKGLLYDNMIFAEGNKLEQNPYFNYLPLQGNKGEILTISCPDLKLDVIIKGPVFILPLGDGLFRVGATYNREDTTDQATAVAKEYLTTALDKMLTLSYEIIDHRWGVRPTTIDRRPFIGKHEKYNRLWIFNGMGSRGVLIAPWASEHLIAALDKSEKLPPEMDIIRFKQQ